MPKAARIPRKRALGVTLISNNVSEFERVPGLHLENWVYKCHPRSSGGLGMWQSISGDVFLNIFRADVVTVRAPDFFTGNFHKHVPFPKQGFRTQLIQNDF